MDDPNTTNSSGTHEADEDILTYTVADEATEAAAGIERGGGWCLSHLVLQFNLL
jgi:hypothetical protein